MTAAERPRDAYVSQFSALTRDVRESGLLRRRYDYYWPRLIGAALGFGAIIAAIALIGSTWWLLVLAAVMGVVMTQIAFLGHDAAHKQIFASGKWNDWTAIVLANLFVGLSHGWWQGKHSKHHANPNKRGSDPDIDLPYVTFTPEQADERRHPLTDWFLKRQGWFFFPMLLLEGLDLHLTSTKRVLGRAPLKRRTVEIVFLGIRLIAFPAFLFLVLSPGVAAAFLGVQLAVFGVYMGASFAPNHVGMPIVPKDMRLDFLRRQTLMSRNITGGRWVDAAMGGLNFQVEHHLFPNMPRPNLRAVAPKVREFCAEHRVTYTETTLWRSYGIVVRHLNEVGLGVRDTFTCPLVAAYR
ncbi:fatty acid desaturase family protein [Ruania halotolerans]|uniref:fatty acid desaturase family protein n=1 Tax=Ruania halotolerans TaxID=2897773 RepID=UPI001E53A6EE|nr:acyl-CoA desaturase [Ruania halotolerans]UFU05996.1 acyl-CoA desaturase [Ruania halotolerans]